MGIVKGTNYTLAETPTPGNLLDAGVWGGKVRCQIDTYEASSLEAGSIIKMARLPAGARLLPNSLIMHDALGAGVQIKAGHNDALAGADDDGFAPLTLSSAAGVIEFWQATAALDNLPFEYQQDADLILTTSGAAATGTIQTVTFYTTE